MVSVSVKITQACIFSTIFAQTDNVSYAAKRFWHIEARKQKHKERLLILSTGQSRNHDAAYPCHLSSLLSSGNRRHSTFSFRELLSLIFSPQTLKKIPGRNFRVFIGNIFEIAHNDLTYIDSRALFQVQNPTIIMSLFYNILYLKPHQLVAEVLFEIFFVFLHFFVARLYQQRIVNSAIQMLYIILLVTMNILNMLY